MKNEHTIKQIRFCGLSKILIDQVGRNSTNIINDIVSDNIKRRDFDILNRYFTPKQKELIIAELEKVLGSEKATKAEAVKKEKNDQIDLEIEAKGFNI